MVPIRSQAYYAEIYQLNFAISIHYWPEAFIGDRVVEAMSTNNT